LKECCGAEINGPPSELLGFSGHKPKDAMKEALSLPQCNCSGLKLSLSLFAKYLAEAKLVPFDETGDRGWP
jgi:hypothetical protein